MADMTTKRQTPSHGVLTSIDDIEALRSSPSAPAVRAFKETLLAEGYVFDTLTAEWVRPGDGERGRLNWNPDASNIWLAGPDRKPFRSLTGNDPFTGDPIAS